MPKNRQKAQRRLQARRNTATSKAGTRGSGFHAPGSQNPHKSYPIGKRR